MRSYWIIQVSPKFNVKCSFIWDTWRRKHREGDVRMEAEIGIMWPQAKEGRNAWHHQKLEGTRNRICSLTASGGNIAFLTSWFWTSSLQNCEKINFKPPGVGIIYNSVRKLMHHTILKYSLSGPWRQCLLTLALESSLLKYNSAKKTQTY